MPNDPTISSGANDANDALTRSPARPAPIGDDELREMMRDEEPTFLERNSGRVVTLALIAVNVVCFIAEMALSGTEVEGCVSCAL